ncbi:hypothetical protein PQQ51_16290 [Paraburkholderia xenovorans]|uniref:hypothetical protein n=1 Tax=Paraburkholderia xenovorans TaxID=36873 RepID=UPI0038B7063C
MTADISVIAKQAERSLHPTTFRGWPALCLMQQRLRLTVVPAVGGRLMSIEYDGVELAYVNDDIAGELPDGSEAQWQRLCGAWSFPLWGGGKTWVSPESDWPDGAPHKVLDSGVYALVAAWCDERSMGVELQSAVCPDSGLQIRRRISLDAADNVWTTRHVLANKGTADIRCGIWDVLMLRRPGTVRVKLSGDSPDWRERILPFVEKGPLGDARDSKYVVRESDSLEVRCVDPIEFKIGVLPDHEVLVVTQTLPEGCFTLTRRAEINSEPDYAHGRPVEIFNAPRLPYFEIESHSPCIALTPNAECELVVQESVNRST